MITVGSDELNVDVRAELEDFPWINAIWSTTRLMAASPFRYERHPSFYVILDESDPAYGAWGDRGAHDPEWQRGGFVKLLAFLRDETYEETADYLRAKYGVRSSDDEITLRVPRLAADKPRITRIDSAILDRYRFRSSYLGQRGITEAVQRLMRIGYDKSRRAVTIPWFNADDSLGNVKYRRTDSKTFWYASNARPIREMVYGIDVMYSRRIKRAAIVEAEIDALTLMSCGFPAIATGGTAFNSAKRDAILRSPIEEIIVFRDNDPAGRAWRNRVIADLYGKIDVSIALVPTRCKDVNEWIAGGYGPIDVAAVAFETRRIPSLIIS